MKQKDKELLLIDLSARLPHGVKVWYKYATWPNPKYLTCLVIPDNKVWISSKLNKLGDSISFEEAEEILIKPYLRPMSSMTEEEKKEFSRLAVGTHLFKGPLIPSYDTLDWLNAHHFDYRELIPKGLALEAPERMYN